MAQKILPGYELDFSDALVPCAPTSQDLFGQVLKYKNLMGVLFCSIFGDIIHLAVNLTAFRLRQKQLN